MIASFSRALTEGLSAQQSDADFDRVLAATMTRFIRPQKRAEAAPQDGPRPRPDARPDRSGPDFCIIRADFYLRIRPTCIVITPNSKTLVAGVQAGRTLRLMTQPDLDTSSIDSLRRSLATLQLYVRAMILVCELFGCVPGWMTKPMARIGARLDWLEDSILECDYPESEALAQIRAFKAERDAAAQARAAEAEGDIALRAVESACSARAALGPPRIAHLFRTRTFCAMPAPARPSVPQARPPPIPISGQLRRRTRPAGPVARAGKIRASCHNPVRHAMPAHLVPIPF